MIYGSVPQNKGDILILVANISSGYKIAILLNRGNDSLEHHLLMEYRTTDVRKRRLDVKSKVISMELHLRFQSLNSKKATQRVSDIFSALPLSFLDHSQALPNHTFTCCLPLSMHRKFRLLF